MHLVEVIIVRLMFFGLSISFLASFFIPLSGHIRFPTKKEICMSFT